MHCGIQYGVMVENQFMTYSAEFSLILMVLTNFSDIKFCIIYFGKLALPHVQCASI